MLDPWRTALHAAATRAYARGEAADPAPVQLALEASAARICLPWLVDPATVTDDDPAARAGRIEDLVHTLVNPPPGR